MSFPNQVSVVILVESAPVEASLAETLHAVSSASEILVADAVGLEQSLLAEHAVWLPLMGHRGLTLRYRAGLEATGDWLLFLKPGDVPGDAFLNELGSVIANGADDQGYTFLRRLQIGGMPYQLAEATPDPDFVPKSLYLHQLMRGKSFNLATMQHPLDCTADKDGFDLVLQDVRDTVTRSVEREGTQSLQGKSRFNAILRTLFVEGICKRHLFRDSSVRDALLMRVLQGVLVDLNRAERRKQLEALRLGE